MTSQPKLPFRVGKDRFIWLLIGLFVFFILSPVMLYLDLMRFFQLAFVALLAFAVVTIADSKKHLVLALVFGIPAVALQLLAYPTPTRALMFLSNGVALAFLLLLIWVIYGNVLRPGKVRFEKIAGAVCVYLLIGLAFSIGYTMIAVVNPEAFIVNERIIERLQTTTRSIYAIDDVFIYFSFVTLTTLGYGDMSPLSPLAQTVAWIEAVVGQLFVGVTIARLVGLLTAGQAQRNEA